MIKGYYIDSVTDLINGGDDNDKKEVWREDIDSLLPAAVNFVVVGALWEQFAREGDKDINNGFIMPFLNVVLNTVGSKTTFTIPETIIPLPSDRGVRMVTSVEGDHLYQKMNDNLYSNWNYYKKIMINQRFYRLIGQTGIVYNKPALETEVNLYLLVTADNYADTDELPVPAGKELAVVQQLFVLFSKQRAEAQQNIQFKSDFNK